ncbi:glucose-1-phosphate cytidylyltransferase [Mangrovibacterium diazotrophicum]|uniref:Glucose-1-phosphate cytidylyltransferase n=1 Tax=Mangrovibacterium diazotrophicum TaxID=1261403 RepID=A0A419VVR7_9BACT|nr:glucose-1-phosphate cytidylyltransferase [Mangrovibacterium diazotrophicum]RKD86201.1 glucose-1-phosphate cytidylyltransferase [Mangrovibacterium diazotrophicum]
MKVLILAGGLGTRLSEETKIKPKPMVEIGGYPIIWHIMKIYAAHGHNDFIVLCGYKGYIIKEFFANYLQNHSDIHVDLEKNEISYLKSNVEPWKVTLIDTGSETLTGGRIKRVKDLVGNEPFLLTYGDGVSNVDITETIKFHKSQNSLVTLSAIKPPGRFGTFSLQSDGNTIANFREKPSGDGSESAWINGGFFVVEPEAFNYIDGDQTIWERDPLENIASEGKLSAYRHHGFWHPMDTLRDKHTLEELWASGEAPWKIWN